VSTKAVAADPSLARQLALWALRLGIGGLFLYTGVIKLLDPAAFAIEISNYQIFPELAPHGAAMLPSLELVLGLSLVAGPRPWARAGALGTGGLMLVFTLAVVTVVARGVNISCGCFGAGSGPVTMLTVLRDVALLAACALIYAWSGDREPARA
jgi:uncharacterized membrane protein YphA (DoxX/SURF4 family)